MSTQDGYDWPNNVQDERWPDQPSLAEWEQYYANREAQEREFARWRAKQRSRELHWAAMTSPTPHEQPPVLSQPMAPYFREMLGLRKQPGQGYRVEPNEALCDAATRAFNLRE